MRHRVEQQRGYHSANVLLGLKNKSSWVELKHLSVNKVGPACIQLQRLRITLGTVAPQLC